MTWWPDGRGQLRAGISSGFPEKWRRWPESLPWPNPGSTVKRPSLRRRPSQRRRHHRSGNLAGARKIRSTGQRRGCAAAANETGATISIPSQRAGNDRSKQDPAAAAVPSEFARRGDLKGLSEGRPPFTAPPGAFRCRTCSTAGSAGDPRRRREEQQDSDIIGIPDPPFGGLAQFL